MFDPSGNSAGTSVIPDDDPRRWLVVARPDADASLLDIGPAIRTRSCCGVRIPAAATALLTCTFRRAAGRLRIGMASRGRS
jgi:hypothetical protein